MTRVFAYILEQAVPRVFSLGLNVVGAKGSFINDARKEGRVEIM